MIRTTRSLGPAFALAAVLPVPALAHPGHGASLLAGAVHPWTGIDHLAAMLLVGLCARLVRARAWIVPLAFLGGLIAGFLFDGPALSRPLIEGAIVASVIALGVAGLWRQAIPALPAGAAVAAFGFAHGTAHAMELPEGAKPYLFAAGFLASSALLHGGGYWLSRRLPVPAQRLIGAAGAGLGLFLAGAA